ncbi:hypothetical protein LTR11_006944 [Exophiala xenobiotica]|nr:hypothetical protein LTR40_004901 [Exophiala xenobiotica]KAK5369612.1 hypothetical protein LTR11_006944 [Exophiala xenobiotica]
MVSAEVQRAMINIANLFFLFLAVGNGARLPVTCWGSPDPLSAGDSDGCNATTNATSTIVRDILIYGGGVSGSHAASRLREMGKSVVVVEMEGRLGGAAHAFRDPVNNKSADYGVQILWNTTAVRNLYGRYNIPLTTVDIATGAPNIFADFGSGQPVQLHSYSGTSMQATFARLFRLETQYSFLNDFYDLPRTVPQDSDLLLSVDEFVQKHDLQPLIQLFNHFLQQWPEFRTLPALYLLKYMIGAAGPDILGETTWVHNANDDNGELFRSIQAELGKDALLSSTIVRTERMAEQNITRAWVQTPTGVVEVHAKRILVTVPPVMENMGVFDLDAQEENVFQSFQPMNAWTGLVRNSNIPSDTIITNVGVNTTFQEIQLPGSQGYQPTPDPLLHSWVYTSYGPTTEQQTRRLMLAELARLTSSGVIEAAENSTDNPEIMAIKHHHNYALTVSKELIAGGFYTRLNGLQGHRGTVYGGAAFTTQGTANVIQYNENHVLPMLAFV